MKMQLSEVLSGAADYEVPQRLGKGGEGTVYLLRDRETGANSVLKIFHEPIYGSSGDGLRSYAAHVDAAEYGLASIKLVGTNRCICAVQYPYSPLYRVHPRFYRHWPGTRKAAFGAYCRMQHYLMAEPGIGLADTVVHNFLLAPDGQFHFVDYGFAIKCVDHPRYVAVDRFGYAFVMMLLSLFGINIKTEVTLQDRCFVNGPSPYLQAPSLTRLAEHRGWVARIVQRARQETAAIFRNADFYGELAETLPSRVHAPRLIILGSRLLTRLH